MSETPQDYLPLSDPPAGQPMPLQRGPRRHVCERAECGKALTGKQERWCSETCRWKVWDAAHPRLPGRARQAALPGESRVERAFAAWIDTPAGRYVEAEVTRMAWALQARGVRRYGIAGIWEAIRYDSAISWDDDCYKLNNNFRSLMARRVMERVLELREFFETRDLRGRR